MQYYRCECGSQVSHTSMGVPSCKRCEQCGTGLAWCPRDESDKSKVWIPKPGNFPTPTEHEYETRYNVNTGEAYELCSGCGQVKDIEKEAVIA